MGSENLHHKRKAKKNADLQRKEQAKEPYQTVLIVCEGKKTEPIYFTELISDLKLKTANIKILSSTSTCPLKLVQYARERAEFDDFDFVYCVFDKDTHTKYDAAIQLLRESGEKFVAANSVPCFEYWLLLHFDYMAAPFYGNPSKSPGDEAVALLKKKIPNYEKARTGTYNELKPRINEAIANAKRANNCAHRTRTDNPTTNVVSLVSLLMKISDDMDI